MTQLNSIPLEVAESCCREYREKKKVKMFSQCWGCLRFSKGEPDKMCFHSSSGNRGCKFVNQKYEEATKQLCQ